jgi:hypothetical protein
MAERETGNRWLAIPIFLVGVAVAAIAGWLLRHSPAAETSGGGGWVPFVVSRRSSSL